MKTKTFVLNGTGAQVSPWHRIEHRDSFNVGVYVDLSNSSDASFGVDVGFSDMANDVINGVSITRSGTTATFQTVNKYLTSLKTGDSVVVAGCGAPFDGTYTVTNTAGVISYTVTNSGLTASTPGNAAVVTMIRVWAFNTAQTTGAGFSVQTPCDFIRVNVATATAGQVAVTIAQGND